VKLRKDLRKLLRFLPLLIGGTGVDVFLLSRLPKLPAALIPTRWSEFSFWTELAKSGRERVRAWLAIPTGGDVALLFSMMGVAVVMGITLLLMTILMGKSRVEKPQHALIGCAGAIAALFLMALHYAKQGGLELSLAMWLMPCLWILMDYAIYWWRGWHSQHDRRERYEKG